MLSILDLKPQPEGQSAPASKPSPAAVDAQTTPAEAVNTPSESIKTSTKTQAETGAPASPPPMKKTVRPALRSTEVPVSEPVNIPEEPVAEAAAPSAASKAEGSDEQDEYELVLGRRQIASWLFVGTFLIAVCSVASYYIGKTSATNAFAELDGKSAPYIAPNPGANTAPAAAPSVAPRLPQATFVIPAQNPIPAAKIPASAPASPSQNSPVPAALPSAIPATTIREWNEAASSAHPNDPPIYATPQTGALYLQMGAVDRGMAVVLAEGLRRHGFSSFVAPGPTEKIFRVLIGPFTNPDDFKRAKAEVDAIDLGTFARRFEK